MTRQANILSFDEVKAREASSPRTVSPSVSSRRAYDVHRQSSQSAPQRASRSNTPRVSRVRSYRQAQASRFAEEGYAQSRNPYQGRSSYRRSSQQENRSSSQRAGRGYAASVTANRRGYAESYAQSRRGYQSQGRSAYAGQRNVSSSASGVRSRRFDDAQQENGEEAAARRSAQRKQSESFSAEIRKRFRTAKADREYDRTIGARERAKQRMEEQEQGSRAAVYDMRMGASQRKSARMAEDAHKGRTSGFSLPFALPFGGSISAWATRTVVAFVAVAFAVVMLYPSCQNYYNETRQLQQLQAEYDALQSYNTQMQNQVDYLNTDEGIEDYARSELGWIRPGEHVVTVEGVTSSSDNTRSNSRVYAIPAGSVAAPDTWYSGILDVIFGYGH